MRVSDTVGLTLFSWAVAPCVFQLQCCSLTVAPAWEHSLPVLFVNICLLNWVYCSCWQQHIILKFNNYALRINFILSWLKVINFASFIFFNWGKTGNTGIFIKRKWSETRKAFEEYCNFYLWNSLYWMVSWKLLPFVCAAALAYVKVAFGFPAVWEQ